MEAYELNHNSISDKTKKESRVSLDNEKILCNHCKRTASNGIRCLGICCLLYTSDAADEL